MPSEKLRAQKKLKFYNIEKKLFDFINGYVNHSIEKCNL
jgi:hypothetical protein